MQTEKKVKMFSALIRELLSRSPAGEGAPLKVILRINPDSGGFKIKKRWRSYIKELKEAVRLSKSNKGRKVLFYESLKRDFRADILLENTECFQIVIAAGGDGTHLAIMTEIFNALPREGFRKIRGNFAVVRLPFGTGNDAACGHNFSEVLKLLYMPSRVEFVPAVILTNSSAGPNPFIAFNILSLGLDAFVTRMVNKIKGRLPGDSYKFWVDIASVFYDIIYKTEGCAAAVFDEAGEKIGGFSGNLLLLAVGAGGFRTYGSQKRILPDSRNVCIVNNMPLFRKIAVKDKFTTGEHINLPECLLYTAKKIEFSCKNPILAQMDGEAHLLLPKDFPAKIEISPPAVPVLKLAIK